MKKLKKNAVRDISQLKHIITNLFKEIDQTNMKEFLFYKSLLIFSDSVGYLNPPELKELNDLFEEVHSYQCDIKYPISKDQLLFYSYNRYPQKSK